GEPEDLGGIGGADRRTELEDLVDLERLPGDAGELQARREEIVDEEGADVGCEAVECEAERVSHLDPGPEGAVPFDVVAEVPAAPEGRVAGVQEGIAEQKGEVVPRVRVEAPARDRVGGELTFATEEV